MLLKTLFKTAYVKRIFHITEEMCGWETKKAAERNKNISHYTCLSLTPFLTEADNKHKHPTYKTFYYKVSHFSISKYHIVLVFQHLLNL